MNKLGTIITECVDIAQNAGMDVTVFTAGHLFGRWAREAGLDSERDTLVPQHLEDQFRAAWRDKLARYGYATGVEVTL